jgi:hypothetical protein
VNVIPATGAGVGIGVGGDTVGTVTVTALLEPEQQFVAAGAVACACAHAKGKLISARNESSPAPLDINLLPLSFFRSLCIKFLLPDILSSYTNEYQISLKKL